MSSDQPGSGNWTNPGQSPTEPAAAMPGASAGWGSLPPPAPPPGGWGSPTPYGWIPPQAPRPGVVPLRPLGVGELLDGAFTTIRRYPAATLGLSAAVMLFAEVVQLVASYYLLHGVAQNTTTAFGTTQTNTDFVARSFALDGIVLVVTGIATVLLTGMLTTVVGQAVLARPMGIKDAWHGARPLILRLIGATIAVPLLLLAIVVGGAVPGLVLLVVGALASSHALEVVGIVLAIVGGITAAVYAVYVGVGLSLTTPALVLEKLTIRDAMSRSRALVRTSWWRVLGITLLAQIIAGIIGGIIQVPFDLAGGLGSIFSGHPHDQFTFGSLLLTGIGGLLSATLVRPFSAGVIALLYIDRRMRAEALDLTLQQAASAQPA